MNITIRNQVLAEGDARVWEQLAEEIVGISRVTVVKPPSISLVTLRARDSVEDVVVNLGEVFVTECEVELDRVRGWGYVLGNEPVKALAIATIDAALNANHELTDKILEIIKMQQEALEWQQEIAYEVTRRRKVKVGTAGA